TKHPETLIETMVESAQSKTVPITYVDTSVVIAVFAITNAFFIGTTIIFCLRRNHEYLRQRLVPVVFVGALSAIILINGFLSQFPTFRIQLPCVLFMIIYYEIAPLWVFTLFLRTGHLLLMYVSTQARLERSIYGKILIYDRLNLFDKVMLRLHIFIFGSKPGHWQSGKNAKIAARQLTKTIVIFLVLQVLVFIIAASLKKGDLSSCTNSDFTVLYVYLSIFVLTIPYSLYVIRDISDSFHIRKEIVVTFTLFYSVFAIYLLSVFAFRQLQSPLLESSIYLCALLVMSHTANVVYPVGISYWSDYRRKNLSLGKDSFEKTMEDPVLWQEFKQVLAQGFAVENGLFVDEYRNLRKRMRGTQPRRPGVTGETINNLTVSRDAKSMAPGIDQAVTLQDEEMLIFENFVKVGSPNELNIPSHVRANCEKKLKERVAGSEANEDPFDEVYTEVCAMMYQNSFPRFVKQHKEGTTK
ncbi:hypothetical protein HK102_012907, partial [Quaeritorhiza haematococci]